ncbi:MAG: site-2 protease family protein [Bradymonadales bacterium]|nr:site-2 protease family protein [Bradymonadales bacterium]
MMQFGPNTIRLILLTVVAMVLSSAVHEWAHAMVAFKLGDDTAARQGRLTLNPMSHIDPVGTLIMPAVGAMVGFLFGYARPVPVTPVRFTRRFNMGTGMLLVALAGPLSNLVMAFCCAGLLKVGALVGGAEIYGSNELAHMLGALLFVGVWLNIVLCLFNLLPIYPLDGSRILEGLLPRRHHRWLEVMHQQGMLFMLLVFFIGMRLLSGPIGSLARLIFRAFGLSYQELGPFLDYL